MSAAFPGIYRFRRPLHEVRYPVEFGCMPPEPKHVQSDEAAVQVGPHKFFGDNGICAARARESGCFGNRPELDRARPRAFYLKYAVRNILFGNKTLVCAVK